MDITGMEATGEDTEVTTGPMDTMATMERDLLMKPPLPNLAPTPTPKLTPGMDTTATATDHTDTATLGRDLPMKLPLLSPAPTPTPKLTPGMDIWLRLQTIRLWLLRWLQRLLLGIR